jgi:hypothetical protein
MPVAAAPSEVTGTDATGTDATGTDATAAGTGTVSADDAAVPRSTNRVLAGPVEQLTAGATVSGADATPPAAAVPASRSSRAPPPA